MGTAIVSIALSLDGVETLSRITLAIAAVIWVALALLLPLRAARDPSGFRADTRTPAALTAVVAPAVLGSRLTSLGWAWAGIAMLVIALVLWAALLGPVLAGWKSPTVGVSLLLGCGSPSPRGRSSSRSRSSMPSTPYAVRDRRTAVPRARPMRSGCRIPVKRAQLPDLGSWGSATRASAHSPLVPRGSNG
jgi:hypothetical protein